MQQEQNAEAEVTFSHHVLNLLWQERHKHSFEGWVLDLFDTGATWEELVDAIAEELDGRTVTDRTLKAWFPELRRYVPADRSERDTGAAA